MRNLIQTYQEKYSIFECGFHSFLGQNRTQFGIKFFIFALVYLLLDLEILLTFPFALSEYINDIYGSIIAVSFLVIVTLGFSFELGKNALKIDSRQVTTSLNVKSSNVTELISKSNFLGNKKITFNSNQKRFFSNKGKINNKKNYLETIFSYTDISRLYILKKEYIEEYSSIIFLVMAILFVISLFIIMFSFEDISLNIYSILPGCISSLSLVYLMYKNRDLLKKLSINSLYVISNIFLLSLFLGGVIYLFFLLGIKTSFIEGNTMSFMDSFMVAKKIIGFYIGLKLIYGISKLVYNNIKKPKEFISQLILLGLSLSAIVFFYQVINIIIIPLQSLFLLLIACCFAAGEVDNSSILSMVKNLDHSLNHNFNKLYPLISHTEGHYFYTEEGKKIYDAASGAGVSCLGYTNKEVVDILTKKVASNAYIPSSFFKDIDVLALQEFLAASTKIPLTKVYLTGSGSDATEGMLKLCRQFYYDQDENTQRDTVIARERSYHGNTLGALNISHFDARQVPYKDILNGNKVEHISPCNPYRQLLDGESEQDFVARKALELEQKILEIGKKKVMCLVLETVSGAALGCDTPVPGYLKALQDVCHKYGVLFVLDEVMCGMGRTGSLHAWQLEEGVKPDIFLIGKGLAGGFYPLAAILVSPEVWGPLKNEQFIHGLTFDAMPPGAAVALKVQLIIQRDGLIENVAKQGAYLEHCLKTKLSNHPNVGDIRGRGFFWGIEFVQNKSTKEPFNYEVGVSQKIFEALIKQNMLVYSSTGCVDGKNGDIIMIMPHYNITSKDVDHIVDVVSTVIHSYFK